MQEIEITFKTQLANTVACEHERHLGIKETYSVGNYEENYSNKCAGFIGSNFVS